MRPLVIDFWIDNSNKFMAIRCGQRVGDYQEICKAAGKTP